MFSVYLLYKIYRGTSEMKQHIGLTIDCQLLEEIERLRGREKRSTFIEHLVRLGLKAHKGLGGADGKDV